jgi:hypothetical protein
MRLALSRGEESDSGSGSELLTSYDLIESLCSTLCKPCLIVQVNSELIHYYIPSLHTITFVDRSVVGQSVLVLVVA